MTKIPIGNSMQKQTHFSNLLWLCAISLPAKTWRKCQSVFDLKMKAETSQIKTMIQPLSGMLYHVNK